MNKASAVAFAVVLLFIAVAIYIVYTSIQPDFGGADALSPADAATSSPLVADAASATSTPVESLPSDTPAFATPDWMKPTATSSSPATPVIQVQFATETPTLPPTPTSWFSTPPAIIGTPPTPSADATPTPGGDYLYRLDGGVRHDMETSCMSQYIRGTVRDQAGNPVPGVQVRAYDLWGNEARTQSKDGVDAGQWDIVLGGTENVWHVVLLNPSGHEISPVAVVPHHRDGPFQAACTHIVDFRRAW